MEKAERDEFLNELKGIAKKELEAQFATRADKSQEEFDAMLTKRFETLEGVDAEALKLISDKQAELADENKALNDEVAKMKATRSIDQDPKEGLKSILKENWEGISTAVKNKQSYKFELANKVTTASFGDRVIFGLREAGIDFEAYPEFIAGQLAQFNNGGPGSNPLSWVERDRVIASGDTSAYGAETQVAEGDLKKEVNYEWKEAKVLAETIAAWVPVTKQAVNNYQLLEQEMRGELIRSLLAELQRQLINGTGTDEIFGIDSYAKTFAAGAFALGFTNPDPWVVFVAALAQIAKENYMANYLLTTHDIKYLMISAQATDGMPKYPFAMTGGGDASVLGIPILASNDVAAGAFYAGDSTKSLFNYLENPNVEVGHIDDQFIRNQYTILGEWQGMHRIKKHQAFSFVKGDMTTALAALTAGS